MADVNAFFILLVLAYALGSLQFGYHIGELNTPQQVISCNAGDPSISQSKMQGLVDCIAMTTVQYGTIVSMFPIGGLFGSLVAGRLSDTYGRRPIALLNCIGFIIGPLLMTFANGVAVLGIGRVVCGLSSGVSMVSVPIYLSEISPINIRGTIGVMTQLSCVIGILVSQLAGVYLSTIPHWRIILAIGAALGTLQFILLLVSLESPKWLATQPGRFSQAKQTLIRIRGRSDVESEMKLWQDSRDDEDDDRDHFNASHAPLTRDDDDNGNVDEESDTLLRRPSSPTTTRTSNGRAPPSLKTFLFGAAYRPALRAILITQLAQQFTGTNAVIFYSTSLLSTLLPPSASAWTSVAISAVNLTVTLAAAHLIDRTGRRVLLLLSLAGMCAASCSLSVGITYAIPSLAAGAAMGLIGAFGLGVGPIPFLLVSELLDVRAVGLGQSFGLGVNWTATFCIGFLFPVVNEAIGSGLTFAVFASLAALAFGLVWAYVPESRGRTVAEVWSANRLAR